MIRKLSTILGFLAVSLGAFSADFTLRIVNCPKEIPKGAPIFIRGELCNVSGHEITTAVGTGGFVVSVSIKRADGQPITKCPQKISRPTIGFEMQTLPANWAREDFRGVCYGDTTGEFIIQMVVNSRGPYHQRAGKPFGAWEGEIRSEEIRVTVTEPVGIDAEAYREFDGRPSSGLRSVMSELWGMPEGSKLLRSREATRALFEKYTSSTFAAYALLAKVQSFGPVESSPAAAELEMKRKYAHWLVNPSEGKGQHCAAAVPDGVVQAELDAINAVLCNHPNFPFRFVLDYRSGLDYYMLHDYKSARSRLSRCLGEDVAEPIRSEAKVYLDVLDEKKL